jgi:hypothetical protein
MTLSRRDSLRDGSVTDWSWTFAMASYQRAEGSDGVGGWPRSCALAGVLLASQGRRISRSVPPSAVTRRISPGPAHQALDLAPLALHQRVLRQQESERGLMRHLLDELDPHARPQVEGVAVLTLLIRLLIARCHF